MSAHRANTTFSVPTERRKDALFNWPTITLRTLDFWRGHAHKTLQNKCLSTNNLFGVLLLLEELELSAGN